MSKLHFLDGFESANPDVFHRIIFNFFRPVMSGQRCLNVGCWTGGFEKIISEQAHIDLTSIDYCLDALKTAKKSLPRHSFICADANKLPFKKKTFGVASLFFVIEHFPRNKELDILKQINSSLTPEGKLLVVTHRHSLFTNITDIAYWLKGHRHYKPAELTKTLKAAGFDVEKIVFKGRGLAIVSMILLYFFKYILRKNIYRDYPGIMRALEREYEQDGYRDIFLVAKKTGEVEL